LSGIAGIFDPAGSRVDELGRACDSVAWRGKPEVFTLGPATLAVLDAGDGDAHVVHTPSSITVIDGRFDAALSPRTRAAVGSTVDGDAFLQVLMSGGPGALDEVAADFALVRWDADHDELLLTRDAFGSRPLFYAWRGERFAFASDPEILFTLDIADDGLDRERVTAFLAGRDYGGERTAFAAIRRVLGGWSVTWNATSARTTAVKWLDLERVQEQPWTLDEAAATLRPLLIDAIRDRARGRRVGILLSGGRDSGAIALAAAAADLSSPPICFTNVYDPDLPCNESAAAHQLAAAAGLECIDIECDSQVTLDDLERLPGDAGGPIAMPSFAHTLTPATVAVARGVTVMLNGLGGEPLFAAGPVAVLDALRTGSVRDAWTIARAFPARWRHRPVVVAKEVARAIAPPRLIEVREAHRRPFPWLPPGGPPPEFHPPRSARGELISVLESYGTSPIGELMGRLNAKAAITTCAPLFDRRVVDLALSLPVELRVPIPGPKPVLQSAFLDRLDPSRVKANLRPYYERLGRSARECFPAWYGSDSLTVRNGFTVALRPDEVPDGNLPEWLRCLAVEAWLRQHGSETAQIRSRA